MSEQEEKNTKSSYSNRKNFPDQETHSPPEAGSDDKRATPTVLDDTYSGLREENRVVMRHNIALNLESFRAAPDDFVLRRHREYPSLQPVDSPFFSVIIPTFNGWRHLPTVLNALRVQSFHDFEIIVVDDASTDDTPAQLEQEFSDVRLIVNRHNEGFVRACNTGAAAARGRYVVLLNNDTEPEATWLAELAKTAATNPDAAIIASKLLLYDRRDTLHTAGDLMGRDGMPRNRGVWELDQGQYDDQIDIFSGCGGASAYRKDIWQSLGGFDEDLWMYLEDVDYGFRAQLTGYPAVFAPRARVFHHLSASGGDLLASYFVGRNTIWVIAKNMPRSLLRRNLGPIVGAQLRVALDALANYRGAAARARLRGLLAGLLGLPRQLVKRRIIQPLRQVEDGDLARRLQ